VAVAPALSVHGWLTGFHRPAGARTRWVTERSASRRTYSNDENPGSEAAGKTDGSDSSDTPDLNKRKIGNENFFPVDGRPNG